MKNRPWSQTTGRSSATGTGNNYLFGQVRSHREKMMAACEGLQRVYPEFNAGRDAYRAHCDFAITSLSQFKEPVLALRALFRDLLDFSVTSEHYYPLILSLSQASEQGQRLLSLVSAYRQVCQTYSPQLVYQKLEIYDALERLMECSNTTITRIEHFINEMRFLEQTPLYPGEEMPPVDNSCKDEQRTPSETESQHEKVIVLQQYWTYLPHRHPRHSPQTRKAQTCSRPPAQQDTP